MEQTKKLKLEKFNISRIQNLNLIKGGGISGGQTGLGDPPPQGPPPDED